MIDVRDLTVGYEGRTVLGPLEGCFGEGVLLVLGLSRSGKTTLLKALCGLVPPRTGAIVVDGIDLAAGPGPVAEARTHFGMVFQSDALFDSLDATANVALPLLRRKVAPGEARDRAHEALTQVGLAEHAHELPERLSGGMRKRLGLARAIVARPRYLLADDPFTGLDPGTVERVRELLLGLWGTRGGLVLATADPFPVRDVAAEALVLEQGRVIARGPAAQVRRELAVAALFGEEAG